MNDDETPIDILSHINESNVYEVKNVCEKIIYDKLTRSYDKIITSLENRINSEIVKIEEENEIAKINFIKYIKSELNIELDPEFVKAFNIKYQINPLKYFNINFIRWKRTSDVLLYYHIGDLLLLYKVNVDELAIITNLKSLCCVYETVFEIKNLKNNVNELERFLRLFKDNDILKNNKSLDDIHSSVKKMKNVINNSQCIGCASLVILPIILILYCVIF